MTGLHMAGETGGDVPGVFGGEVLQRAVSTNPNITQIIALEAVYEVQADNGRHSFTALLQGGQTGDTAEELASAILKGVILTGWRIGAQVRVKFQKISSCAGKAAGPCFQGTIYIEAAKKKRSANSDGCGASRNHDRGAVSESPPSNGSDNL